MQKGGNDLQRGRLSYTSRDNGLLQLRRVLQDKPLRRFRYLIHGPERPAQIDSSVDAVLTVERSTKFFSEAPHQVDV